MKNDISIVIPIYKVPYEMLKKCIESCINQNYRDIEIVLVDDQSPDECGKICDEYARIDNRIKVIHQKNRGLSGARNSGVMNASGEWIMFLDGDDYIENNMCKELIELNKKYENLEVICCGYKRECNGKIDECKLTGIKDGIYLEKECKYLQKKILNFEAHFSTATCKLIKRNILIENNIFHSEQLKQGSEGIEFNIRLWEHIKKAYVLKKYYYHYMYNNMSISNKHNEKNHELVLKCFKEIKKEIENSSNYKLLIEEFYNRMIYVIITTAVSGYFSPTNKESYFIQKRKFNKYLEDELVKDSLKKIYGKKVNFSRKIVIYCIKFRLYIFVKIIAIIRYYQKNGI